MSVPRAPVLLLGFNRPRHIQQVLSRISDVAPRVLYVSLDGARADVASDSQACEEVANCVRSASRFLDVKVIQQASNLGVNAAQEVGISWFFENEERGIILEDDCVPDPTFFSYCDQLLDLYNLDDRVMHIGGSQYLKPVEVESLIGEDSYFFSRMVNSWGWATWARAWRQYDSSLDKWAHLRTGPMLENTAYDPWLRLHIRAMFDDIVAGGEPFVDSIWRYSIWAAGGVGIAPRLNMVTNTGIGAQATHTHDHGGLGDLFRDGSAMGFPLSHPRNQDVNEQLDVLLASSIYQSANVFRNRIVGRMPTSIADFARRVHRGTRS